MLYIINYIKKYYREITYSISFSFLFVLFLIIGNNLDKFETFYVKFNFIPYFGMFLIISFGCFLFFKNLDKIENFLSEIKFFRKLEEIFFKDNKKSFLNCFIFIFICHLPAFLAFFPGIFSYDAYFQVNVFTLHNTIEIHPIMHSLMLYAVWLFERTFQTGWLGVFTYTLIQSVTVIAIYAYCIKVLNKYNTAYIIKLFSLLFFALYPTNQIFHLIATKDVYFTGFVMLFICFMAELILNREEFLKNRQKKLLLCLSIILMFLFRHNGVHAFLICLPFFLVFFKKDIKKVIIIFLFPLIFMCCFSFVKSFFGLEAASSASSLAVPLQQMARVKTHKAPFLSEIDKKDYAELVTKEKENFYDPFNVDELKFDDLELQRSDYFEKFLKERPKRFLQLYFSWGAKYPIEYIDAFLFNTYKYWYINAKYNKVDYPDSYILFDSDWCSDFYGVELAKKYSILPALRKFYYNLLYLNSFSISKIGTMVFAFAFNTWLLVFCFWILFYKKQYNFIIPLLIIPALFITVLFGPTAVVRYIWQNYQVLPIVLALSLGKFGR